MSNSQIDKNSTSGIMTPEEVALFLRKSTSWVYKHWQELGGKKLGGSLLFPKKENLYEHLFSKRQGQEVEVRLHPEGDQVHRCLVQNENKGSKSPKTTGERS